MEGQSSEEHMKRLRAAMDAATHAFSASLFTASLQAMAAPAVEMVMQSILARMEQQQPETSNKEEQP